MKKLYLIFLILLLLSCKSDRDIISQRDSIHIIVLNDGSEYKGRLLKIENGTVFFVIKGKINEFNRNDVKKIQFKQERMFENFSNINEINDADIKFIWEKSKSIQLNNNEDIAILLSKKDIIIDKDNNYKINIKFGFKILNDNGKEKSTQYFYYNKLFSKARLLYGITISKNGSLSFVEEEAINDEPINNKDPQYDIIHRIKFGLKDTEVGAVHIWEAEINSKFEQLENPFFIDENLVSYEYIEKKIINISYPEEMDLKYEIYNGLINFNKPNIKIKNNGKNKILNIEINKVPPFVDDESNTPEDDKILPSILISFANDWTFLAERYYNKYFSIPIPENIKKFGDSIIGAEKNKEKILKLLYEYINRKIELANVSLKNARYVPLSLDKLLQFTSLNALDKSYLFTMLCKNYEIPVNMAFYKYATNKIIANNLANLKQFDSVLCIAEINSSKKIISFENSQFSLGQRDLETENASALIVSAGNSKIFNLNNFLIDENITEQRYICELNEDDSLKIKRITTVKGLDEKNYRSLRFLSKEELDKNIISRLNSIADDINLISYKFNDLGDFDKSIYLEEDFIINNFSITSSNIKFFNLPGFNYKANNVIREKRTLPFVLNYIGKIKISYEIKIPEKYRVYFVPQDISDTFNDIEFRANFSYNNKLIKFDSETTYKNIEVRVENYNEIKKCFEDRANLSKDWLLIESE